MFRSIQSRITLAFMLVILIGMGILGNRLIDSSRSHQLDDLRSGLQNEAMITGQASVSGFLSEDPHKTLDSLAKTLGGQIDSRITIIALDGTVLGDSDEEPAAMESHTNRPEFRDALEQGSGESTRYSITLGQRMMYVAVPVSHEGETIGVARVALPLSAVEGLVHRLTVSIISAMAITALVIILAGWLIARLITRPIRRLTAASREMASGQLGQRIALAGGNEVRELSRAFNEMSLKLKEMVDTVSADRARLATILDNMADGVIMTDVGGNVSVANNAAKTLFNIDDAAGRTLIEAVRDHEMDALLKLCLRTAQTQTTQYESGAAERYIRAIAIPIGDDQMSEALLLLQDLTELRDLQTTRRELIGNISHEFRTPLAGIKAMVETLRDGAVDDKEAAGDFLNRIDDEVERLTQTVAELTELTRIETGKAELILEPLDLNLLLEEVLGQLGPQVDRRQLSVNKKLADDLPPVQADRARIRQVIVNVVHNAIKFTDPGGKITVATRVHDGTVAVDVSDTGVGISKDDLPHVFERFYKGERARSGGTGTGMGLAIARHVVEAQGGRIWVRSEEGKGSTFSFSLPLEQGPQGETVNNKI
ncbi:MAG: HAMP domain-containing protein [Dehalococcoidia bacterium]|nr:HAMP domain-containing protein [Dehalococcoidia bacterium]